MMIRKSSDFSPIRALYVGHGGKTEVQEARHRVFKGRRRTRRKTEEWKSERKNRRNQGAVRPNWGRGNQGDQRAVRPNRGREE
ncbi:hypothetical protein NDU88_008178 [Pleurodeles waltl]|uniref:Uncharacterized protein n=1 Tax=Pleurodeles waltl TaxID=8319 RepID=A0AAV7VUQ8_PLEWA|nr:hypothetical protein NDU88_008178 [Pleurodeles waltl]